MPPTASIEAWPGRERRAPSRRSPDYLVLAPLAAQLSEAVARHCSGATGLDVLDVGCGEKPYYPLLAPHAATYRGFDVEPGPVVDDVGVAEQLPYEEGRFDVVLCTQVLEHADDPHAVVSEIHRVLKPGGVALVSTHGTFVFHPTPPPERDFWRWTHAGLARLFGAAGTWRDLRVQANGEYVSCVFYLLCRLAGWPLGRVPRRVRELVYAGLNVTAEALERRLPADLRVPNPGSLTANYLVSARKAGE
jgi:SAM-dependent methyltransferase